MRSFRAKQGCIRASSDGRSLSAASGAAGWKAPAITRMCRRAFTDGMSAAAAWWSMRPGGGKRQDVWSKKWSNSNAQEKEREERIKKYNSLSDEEKAKNDAKAAALAKYVINGSGMPRRKIGKQGQEIIDKPTYSKLTRKFLKNGGIIIRGEKAEQHLGTKAYASYLPSLNTAFIRDDATVSDVLEEMYHAEQNRKNMFGKQFTDKVFLQREIDAQKYLISCEKKYKIPIEEMKPTKSNLLGYEKRLNDLLKGE
jgi:hypothetical protein